MNNAEDLLREAYYQTRLMQGTTIVYKEVPVFSRSVDLVECDSALEELTAIEFKITDWKRAITQLSSVSSCFDYLVLCLPNPKTKKCLYKIKERCLNLGIGLITWKANNNEFIYICPPQRANKIWKAQKENVIHYIKSLHQENLYGRNLKAN